MTDERLYGLLPAFYRNRDVEQGEPLRALCAILDAQLSDVEADIAGLYENWFIETCAEWAVPYIGDLLRTQPLNAVPAAGFSARPYVARTLAYRRGKGTVTALAGLARDVTGWPATVVEFFSLLSTTQYLNHLRGSPGGTAGLRDAAALELLGGPFETAPYTVDVRTLSAGRGRYNLPNLGISIWRLQAYPLLGATARASQTPGRYTFNAIGLDAPLFNQPPAVPSGTPLSERDVPAPLRRRTLYDELETLRGSLVDATTAEPAYFAPPPTFSVAVGGTAVPAAQILICDIADAPPNWPGPPASKSYVPSGGGTAVSRPISVAVDPVNGRLAFPATALPTGNVTVSYSYGFSGDTGGGPYDRSSSLSGTLGGTVTWQVAVGAGLTKADGRAYTTFTDAVAAWNAAPSAFGVIAVVDSATYAEALSITVPANSRLLIVAAQWPQVAGGAAADPSQLVPSGIRPHLLGNLQVTGTAGAAGVPSGELIINGLVIEGAVGVEAGQLGSLQLQHATIVPGGSGLTVAGGATSQPNVSVENANLAVTLTNCVCGPIVYPADTLESRTLSITDSIVAGDLGGDAGSSAIAAGNVTASIAGTTIFGSASLAMLEASNTIFAGPLSVARRQSGCVRFSYVPPGSQTPRRYRCQPDSAREEVSDPAAQAAVEARVTPRFSASAYGRADYAQLAPDCPPEIGIGADNGSEMGAFRFLQQPQRAANLAASLDEYLRFGLNAGITYVT